MGVPVRDIDERLGSESGNGDCLIAADHQRQLLADCSAVNCPLSDITSLELGKTI